MAVVISFLLVALALTLAIPVTMLLLEVLAAVLWQTDSLTMSTDEVRRRVAVLIPAHDEGTNLLPTIANIKAQMQRDDRLLVVADNCTDDTAAIASGAGAEVTIRDDPQRRGKGYALAWGLHQFAADPPDIVVIVDADCTLSSSAIDVLATVCARTHRPIQPLYLMLPQADSVTKARVAAFAWRVKNWVRPLGLRALRLPCQLMGSGMTFPWEVISQAELASGHVVEDLKLGLDLARIGYPPLFHPLVTVTSYFPSSVEGTRSQRQRWEGGQIGMILSAAPRLFISSLARPNLGLLMLTLDLAVPPLSLLGAMVAGFVFISGSATWLGVSSAAMVISLATLAAFIVAVFLSWLKYGRDILPPRSMLLIIQYVLAKPALYWRLLSSKSKGDWNRTDRGKD